MSCPVCNANALKQSMIGEDRDFNAIEYECIECGCQYWIERSETITITKQGMTGDEDEE